MLTAHTGSNDVYTDLSSRVRKRGSIQSAVGTSSVLPGIFRSGVLGLARVLNAPAIRVSRMERLALNALSE